MDTPMDQTTRVVLFRNAITSFINERREIKLKDKDDPKTAAKYEYATWLADAARRVTQIQAVTHVLKATHPDARGSSLYIAPDTLPDHAEIGSHVLGETYAQDVVGNAAALDVFKFLKIEIDGRRLLDWMRANDGDLRQALHEDAATATEWMNAFSQLVRDNSQPCAHAMAKQIYWCIGDEPAHDNQYHLLQPMFSSSLAQTVHTDIQDARFGAANTEARKAFYAKKPADTPYHEYHDLAMRKLGGTKPQNISQLNSERGGVNYLLSSLPPKWSSRRSIKLLHIDSAMEQFTWFSGVRAQMRALEKLLLSDPDKVMETRCKREMLEQDLGASLAAFGLEIQEQSEPGWTRSPDCRLPLCEKLWLDPQRSELPPREDHVDQDDAFKAAHAFGDWPDEIAERFGNWINARLRNAGLTSVGDAEFRHWARQAIIDVQWPVPLQRSAGDHS